MTNLKKNFNNITIYLILIFLFIFKGNIINIISNVRYIFDKNDNINQTEINLLKQKNNFLEQELINLSKLDLYTDYDYDLTRLVYRENYSKKEFIISGGLDKRYKENMALINNDGLVGIIKKVYQDYSECIFLKNINNLSVKINNSYGTLSEYKDGYFIINNFTNYDKINLNDEVYTSELGNIKEKIYIGKVDKIEEDGLEKIVLVKSNVDDKDVSYLYVVGNR